MPLEGARILDIGCGIGTYVRRFRQYSDDVYGVDVEPERVAEASVDAAEHPAWRAGEELPFPDDWFDLVFSNEVIEHVDDDRQTIREAVRVTKPGGTIVIFAPNRLYPFETHGAYFGKRYVFGNIPLVNWLPDPLRNRFAPHVRAYTQRGIRSLFRGLPVRAGAPPRASTPASTTSAARHRLHRRRATARPLHAPSTRPCTLRALPFPGGAQARVPELAGGLRTLGAAPERRREAALGGDHDELRAGRDAGPWRRRPAHRRRRSTEGEHAAGRRAVPRSPRAPHRRPSSRRLPSPASTGTRATIRTAMLPIGIVARTSPPDRRGRERRRGKRRDAARVVVAERPVEPRREVRVEEPQHDPQVRPQRRERGTRWPGWRRRRRCSRQGARASRC